MLHRSSSLTLEAASHTKEAPNTKPTQIVFSFSFLSKHSYAAETHTHII